MYINICFLHIYLSGSLVFFHDEFDIEKTLSPFDNPNLLENNHFFIYYQIITHHDLHMNNPHFSHYISCNILIYEEVSSTWFQFFFHLMGLRNVFRWKLKMFASNSKNSCFMCFVYLYIINTTIILLYNFDNDFNTKRN